MSVDWAHLARETLVVADYAVLLYFLFLNGGYAALLTAAIPELWAHYHIAEDENFRELLGSDALPPVSVLVPAYNEEVTIVASTLSFLTLEYPRHEVILVNDGAKDKTMEVLIREFELYQIPPAFAIRIPTQPVRAYYRSRRFSKLLVVDKANGGKADSLNAALNVSRFPYVVAVDADTLIEPDALVRLGRPFLLGQRVAAVGGTIRVVNGSTVTNGRVTDARVDGRWLTGIQTVEYLRAYLFGRLGWNRLGGNIVISGAFGMFRREYMLAINGYQTNNITEDMDLVVRLHRYLCENNLPGELPFIPDPVAWTEVPASAKVLGRQRERWHRGLIGTLFQHKDMIFNRKYGRVGMISMPFFFFGEMLAPLVELFGWFALPLGLYLGAVSRDFALLFLVVAVGYGLLLSVWAVILEATSFRRYRRVSDYLALLGFAVLENFGYRQMTLYFRLQAFWKYYKGVQSWGAMTREGFAPKPPAKP
jgi:cellulose synthase/poly-beta-1,6-N-acetylglucosamine synthase-like glycosyltransferase